MSPGMGSKFQKPQSHLSGEQFALEIIRLDKTQWLKITTSLMVSVGQGRLVFAPQGLSGLSVGRPKAWDWNLEGTFTLMWQVLLVVTWEHYLLSTQVSLCGHSAWVSLGIVTACSRFPRSSIPSRARKMLYSFDDLVLKSHSITSDTHCLLEQKVTSFPARFKGKKYRVAFW